VPDEGKLDNTSTFFFTPLFLSFFGCRNPTKSLGTQESVLSLYDLPGTCAQRLLGEIVKYDLIQERRGRYGRRGEAISEMVKHSLVQGRRGARGRKVN